MDRKRNLSEGDEYEIGTVKKAKTDDNYTFREQPSTSSNINPVNVKMDRKRNRSEGDEMEAKVKNKKMKTIIDHDYELRLLRQKADDEWRDEKQLLMLQQRFRQMKKKEERLRQELEKEDKLKWRALKPEEQQQPPEHCNLINSMDECTLKNRRWPSIGAYVTTDSFAHSELESRDDGFCDDPNASTIEEKNKIEEIIRKYFSVLKMKDE